MKTLVFKDRDDSVVDPVDIGEESLRTLLCRNEDAMKMIVERVDTLVATVADMSGSLIELTGVLKDAIKESNETSKKATIQAEEVTNALTDLSKQLGELNEQLCNRESNSS